VLNNAERKAGKVKLVTHFDRTIRKPVSAPKLKNKGEKIRLSNSFEAIGRIEMNEGLEEFSRPKTPTTFLEVFEKALSSKGRWKTKVGGSSQGVDGERGFSPTNES
jgi:hypothetical protein